MGRRFLLVFLLSMCVCGILHANDKKSFGIRFSGFVKTDAIWDTRQTVDARDGHYLLYPKGPDLDPEGQDQKQRCFPRRTEIRAALV